MKNTNIFSAIARGRDHVKMGIVCQDRVASLREKGVDVIALADGCGSEKISEYGAEMLVDAVCKLFAHRFDELYDADDEAVREAVYDAVIGRYSRAMRNNRAKILQHVGQDDFDEKYEEWNAKTDTEQFYAELMGFSATLQVVAKKGSRAIIARLGDGIIAGIKNGVLELISAEPKDPNNDKNVTIYLTTLMWGHEVMHNDRYWDAFEIIKKENVDDYSMFFITSDGLDYMMIEDASHRFLSLDEAYAGEFMLVNASKKKDKNKEMQALLNDYYDETHDDLSVIVMCDDEVSLEKKLVYEYEGTSRQASSARYEDVVFEIDDGTEIEALPTHTITPNKPEVAKEVEQVAHPSISKKQKVVNVKITEDVEELVRHVRDYGESEEFLDKFTRVLGNCSGNIRNIDNARTIANKGIDEDDEQYVDEYDILMIKEYYDTITQKK